jgi:hypothetical protein
MALKVASSSESRLTLTRLSPASFNACAWRANREPFVVSVRSRSGEIDCEHRNELMQILAHQRLASRQPDLANVL